MVNLTNYLHGDMFASLADPSKNVVYCKTDAVSAFFTQCKKPVTLITHNSDINIDESLYNKKPANILKWYAQNAIWICIIPKIIACILRAKTLGL